MENTPIVFTAADIVWICTSISAIAAALAVIIKTFEKLKTPDKIQDARIDALEKQVEEFKRFFDNDNRRIKSIEDGNRVTQQALLALMGHAINGNDIDRLTKAKDELERYLLDK